MEWGVLLGIEVDVEEVELVSAGTGEPVTEIVRVLDTVGVSVGRGVMVTVSVTVGMSIAAGDGETGVATGGLVAVACVAHGNIQPAFSLKSQAHGKASNAMTTPMASQAQVGKRRGEMGTLRLR